MTDYTELVKDLRDIEKTMFALGTSPINMDNVSIRLAYDKRWGRTAADAAAAIEDMAKHITEMHERVTVLQITRGKLEEEVDALKHDIARAIQNNVNLLSEFQQIGAENMILKAKMEVQE